MLPLSYHQVTLPWWNSKSPPPSVLTLSLSTMDATSLAWAPVAAIVAAARAATRTSPRNGLLRNVEYMICLLLCRAGRNARWQGDPGERPAIPASSGGRLAACEIILG